MSTLIKELSIFMTNSASKTVMFIFDGGNRLPIASSEPKSFQNEWILAQGIVSELVIGRVLIMIVVVELITKTISWESCTQPAKEHIVGDKLLWRLILDITLVWQLVIGVRSVTRDMLVVPATWSSKCSRIHSH